MISKNIDYLVENYRIVLWFLGILFTMNIEKISPHIPIPIKNIIKHKLFKTFIMYIALYTYTKSHFRSGIVTFTIFAASYLIDKLDLKELLTNFRK